MIEFVIWFIIIWLSTGFICSVLDVCVFFRGTKHLIECHINHKDPKVKEIGKMMYKDYTNGPFYFNVTIIFLYTIIGPLTIFVLLADFMRFTFSE